LKPKPSEVQKLAKAEANFTRHRHHVGCIPYNKKRMGGKTTKGSHEMARQTKKKDFCTGSKKSVGKT